MFNRSKSKFIQEIKINLGNFLGEEKEDDVYVVLREPKTEWMLKFAQTDQTDTMAQFKEFKVLLGDIIIRHNFTEDGVKELTASEVADIVYESMPMTKYVMEEYFAAPFFTQEKMTEQQSQASVRTSSKEEN